MFLKEQKPRLLLSEDSSRPLVSVMVYFRPVWLGFWLWLLALTKGAAFGGCFFRSSCFSVVHFWKLVWPCFWLLAFGFLLFEIGGIKSSSIVVSREIKIKGIFYICLTKQLLAFLQLTAHSSFPTAHSPQQLSHSSQPTAAFSHSHSSTKHTLNYRFVRFLFHCRFQFFFSSVFIGYVSF